MKRKASVQLGPQFHGRRKLNNPRLDLLDYYNRDVKPLRSRKKTTSSNVSFGGVIGVGQAAYNIGSSDKPWTTAGQEAGGYVGGLVGAEFGGPIGGVIGGAVGNRVGGFVGSAGDWAMDRIRTRTTTTEATSPTNKSYEEPSELTPLTPNNNMPKAGFAPFNSGKSAVTKSGKAKVASSKKSVKVSKSLREKVQKVINGSLPRGVYRFSCQGFIYIEMSDTPASGTVAQNSVLSTTGISIAATRAVPALFNSKQWFAGYAESGFGLPAARQNNFVPAGAFEYFTPTKFLNAASVLFANKPMPNEFAVLTTQNIATTVETPGAASQGSVPKQFIQINNSYVMLAFKNCAARVMIVDFYVCTMKKTTLLPEGMGVVAQYGDIFTMTWEMMGFESFSLALFENEELVSRLNNRLGDLVISMFEYFVQSDNYKPDLQTVIFYFLLHSKYENNKSDPF